MNYPTPSFNVSASGTSQKQLSPTASIRSVQSGRSHAPSIRSTNTYISSFSQGQNLGEGVSLNWLRPSSQNIGQDASQSQMGQDHNSSRSFVSSSGQAQSGQYQGHISCSPRNSIAASGQSTSQDQIEFLQGLGSERGHLSEEYAGHIRPRGHLHSQNSTCKSAPDSDQDFFHSSERTNCDQDSPASLSDPSVALQGHCQVLTSPRLSLRSSDQNKAPSDPPHFQNFNQTQPLSNNDPSSQTQSHYSGRHQSPSQGNNTGLFRGDTHGPSFDQTQNYQPQFSLLQGQDFDQRRDTWQDNNSSQSQQQVSQDQVAYQTEASPRSQTSGVPSQPVDAPARRQMQSQDQPQGRSYSQSQVQSQGNNPIHSRDPVGSIHRRQSSSSRMNPAVPAFQPIYQTSFQSFPPTQTNISDSPASLLPQHLHLPQLPQPIQTVQAAQPGQLGQPGQSLQHQQSIPQPPEPAHLLQSQQPADMSQPARFGQLAQVPMPVQQMLSTNRVQNEKVRQLIRRIKSVDNLDPDKQESLVEGAEEIGRSSEEFVLWVKNEYERLWHEKEASRQYLNNTAVNLRHAYMERDTLGAERDAARGATEKLESQKAELSKRMDDLEQQWRNFHKEMDQKLAEKNKEIERSRIQLEQQRGQLQYQQGQIDKQTSELAYNNARDVKFVDAAHIKWMAENPASGINSRRNTQSFCQDPFASPSVASTSTFPVSGKGGPGSSTSTNRVGLIGRGFGQSSAYGHVQPNSGPPNATAEQIFPEMRNPPTSSRRYPSLPTGRAARGRLDFHTFHSATESSRAYNTEPGDTPLNPALKSPAKSPVNSTALVLHSASSEDPSSFYQGEIAGLYQLVEGWAMAYCTTPKISNDQLIARSNHVLWTFMMKCTYPGKRQDAHTHLTTLLNNTSTRPWFVVRMGVEYIVEEMFSIKSYKNFSSQVGAELSNVETQLQERGLHNDARQALIDRRAKAIQSAVGSPLWETYRNQQLASHSRHLRDTLGPMLDDKADRSKAGKDLGYIALKAWDISEHMNTSQLTFQVSFPETAGKFVAATMISKDDGHIHPMSLQLSQARLKLIITPVITMRDDRGTTIKAKNLHFATVLTMK